MVSDLTPSQALLRLLERCRIRRGAASAESAVMTHTALGGSEMPVTTGCPEYDNKLLLRYFS